MIWLGWNPQSNNSATLTCNKFYPSHNHAMIQLCRKLNSISALKEIDYEASEADVAFDLYIYNYQMFKFQTFGLIRVVKSMHFICVDSFCTQHCHHWSTGR